MAPNETTPTDSADEGTTSTGAESSTMPDAAELAPEDAAVPTGPAPRKRATRRTTKKAAVAAEADASVAAPTSDSVETDEETVAPVRKRATRKAAAPRKRAPKKAAVDTSDALESVVVTEASAGADRAATVAAVPEAEPDEAAEVRPVVPSFSVLFQAPDAEA
ncbi:MAG TPA: ribonuclease E/G, partial [Intrasporangium sp.]|nr:ribonuclease E/G [Intrasporangium sp.]